MDYINKRVLFKVPHGQFCYGYIQKVDHDNTRFLIFGDDGNYYDRWIDEVTIL